MNKQCREKNQIAKTCKDIQTLLAVKKLPSRLAKIKQTTNAKVQQCCGEGDTAAAGQNINWYVFPEEEFNDTYQKQVYTFTL